MSDAREHYDFLRELNATHEIHYNGIWHRGELGKTFNDGEREFRFARFDCNRCGRVTTAVPDDVAYIREVTP